MAKNDSLKIKLARFFASPKFFWFIVGFLVLQAAWIALSARYPMAFDEDFHLGIIKLYAHHISPFWAHQPESADMFGAVARDPSYLYQYLMSFPYRFLELFTHSQSTIVIMLRFINIGLFTAGLVLFRRLLLKTRVPLAITHLCLLAFVLLPIVPLLAAQINYDNLWLPLVAISLLLTVRLDAIMAKKRRLDARTILLLAITCLTASIVKYTFLPIFVAIVGFLAVRYYQSRQGLRLASLAVSWKKLSWPTQVLLILGLLISGGLFTQRIGINLVRYHTPVPDCSQVLNVEGCSEYGPWIRDYNFKINKVSNERNPLVYTADWFYSMWLRTFFAVAGPTTNNFETRGPLIIPSVVAIVVGLAGLAAFIVTAKELFKKYNAPVFSLFLAVSAIYLASLWLDEYLAWIRTGQPVAINGRYLLAVLILLFVLLAAALYEATKRWPRLQLTLTVVVLLCLAWGGGALTFILRSGDSWYWNNPVVRSANSAIRQTLGPVTPGYRNPIEFL